MRFRRDSHGVAIANADKDQKLLAAFLQGDIQEDIRTGREILDAARQVGKGHIAHYEFCGNAHALVATAGSVRIERLDEETETETHSLPVFTRSLQDWLVFIS